MRGVDANIARSGTDALRTSCRFSRYALIIKLISVTAVFVLIGFSACGRSSTESMVTFVDSSTVFAHRLGPRDAGAPGTGARLFRRLLVLDLQRSFRVKEMYAWIAILAVVGLLLNTVYERLEARAVHWRAK